MSENNIGFNAKFLGCSDDPSREEKPAASFKQVQVKNLKSSFPFSPTAVFMGEGQRGGNTISMKTQ